MRRSAFFETLCDTRSKLTGLPISPNSRAAKRHKGNTRAELYAGSCSGRSLLTEAQARHALAHELVARHVREQFELAESRVVAQALYTHTKETPHFGKQHTGGTRTYSNLGPRPRAVAAPT